MPRGDGTGPRGMGARTGRGLGPCNGYETPGFTNGVLGRGLGLGARLRAFRGRFSGFPGRPRLGGRGGGRAGRRRRW